MNQRVKHILGMLSMFWSIFISLYVFFACCSISNTLWCIFFKNIFTFSSQVFWFYLCWFCIFGGINLYKEDICKWTLYKADTFWCPKWKFCLWNSMYSRYGNQKSVFVNEDWFFCSLLLCITFHSFLCTVHYLLCTFSGKMATYSLAIDNVYFLISS